MKKLISILSAIALTSTSSISSSSQILSSDKITNFMKKLETNNSFNDPYFIFDSISKDTVATTENTPIIKYLINTLSTWFEGSYLNNAHYIGNLTPTEQQDALVEADSGPNKNILNNNGAAVHLVQDPKHPDQWAMTLTKSVWNDFTINGLNPDGSENPGKPLLPPELSTDKFFIDDSLGTAKQKEDAFTYVFSQYYLQPYPTPPAPYVPPKDPPYKPDPQAKIWKVNHGIWFFGYTTYYLNEVATKDLLNNLNSQGEQIATASLVTAILGCLMPGLGTLASIIGLILSIFGWDCSTLASKISAVDKGKGINYISWASIPLPFPHSNSLLDLNNSVKNYISNNLNDDPHPDDNQVWNTDLTSIPISSTYSQPKLMEENMTSASTGTKYYDPDPDSPGDVTSEDLIHNYANNNVDELKYDLLDSNGVWDLQGKFGSETNVRKDPGYFEYFKYPIGSFKVNYTSTGIDFEDSYTFKDDYTIGSLHSITYNMDITYRYNYGSKTTIPNMDLIIKGSLNWLWQGSSKYTGNYYNIINNILIFNSINKKQW